MESFFNSKVYLVTGGATGIGVAVVELLLSYGAYVYATDIFEQQSPELAALPQERLTYLLGDVKDRKKSHEIVNFIIQKHNRLDGLVNNAAICLQEGEIPSDEMYDETFDVNCRGPWNLATEVFPHMVTQKGGSIVNLGSLASLAGEGRLPAYTATKHALVGLTKTWALDFAKHGIRVNMIAPGPTDTLMVRRTLKKVMGPIYGMDKTEEELLEQVSSTRVPMRRLGKPREIAHSIAFFLSDLSSFTTGQVLVVGGGT